MAFAFDQTVGGASATNTASLQFADAYFETRPFATAWTALEDEPEKKRMLLVAAANRLEDEERTLAGDRVTTTQRLSQPRYEGYDDCNASYALPEVRSGSTIDRCWKEAECEMALWLAEQTTSPTTVNPLAQFSEVEMASGTRVKLRDDAPKTNDALPVAVRRKLRRFRRADVGGVVRA